MSERINKIYLPFLLVSVGYLIGYTFLKWLFIIQLHVIEPKKELINIWIPMAISGLLVLLLLRSRIKALNFKEKGNEFWGFIMWLILTAPVIFGQFYIEIKSGKLTIVNEPSEIENFNSTKYYSIKEYSNLKQFGGLWTMRESANKHGTEIRIICHFVCPIVDREIDNPFKVPKFNTWLGVTFSEKFGNNSFHKDKQKELINNFINQSIKKYEN